jgi:hypothetical protein
VVAGCGAVVVAGRGGGCSGDVAAPDNGGDVYNASVDSTACGICGCPSIAYSDRNTIGGTATPGGAAGRPQRLSGCQQQQRGRCQLAADKRQCAQQ